MASPQQIRTDATDILRIRHPVLLAGMNVAAGPQLAAAVTNAGGLGVIGGVTYTPEILREQIDELKNHLKDKNAPFGVDLLIPKVGGAARRINKDYTKGKLNEMLDIIIEKGASLFVCAVGVPPQEAVEKLHKAGVLYMNVVGHPKHVLKCLERGADLICAQGGEAGGHTGEVPTSVLLPAVAKILRQAPHSKFTGRPVQLIAAGGLYNGQSLAASFMFGASAVWIGTRFILSVEAGASQEHQEALRTAGFDDMVRTIIFTGRPLRVKINDYVRNWEQNRQNEIKELTSRGVIPVDHDLEYNDLSDVQVDQAAPQAMGIVAGLVDERKTAKEIVDEFVHDAVHLLRQSGTFLVPRRNL